MIEWYEKPAISTQKRSQGLPGGSLRLHVELRHGTKEAAKTAWRAHSEASSLVFKAKRTLEVGLATYQIGIKDEKC